MQTVAQEGELWHRRLGHPSLFTQNLMKLPVNENFCEGSDWGRKLILDHRYKIKDARSQTKVEEVRVNAGKQPKKGKKDISHKADLRRKGIKNQEKERSTTILRCQRAKR
ncbi:hypothetical protein JTE90_028595 [Oedothorax gibbosus]|uniref:GAG-pre-integrase domain-containing protein n=1 Tax=Oedothorax gibbosus TaxID=931172 RepID=A0AAV6TY37_9ARAC|nr:hypothetical protein JTE90_028595 [Oedothorax gibbosus]